MPVPDVVHAASLPDNCLVRNDWVCPLYWQTRQEQILSALGQHVLILGVTMGVSLALALPLAVVAHRSRALTGAVLGASTVIYTIPSLALFSVIFPFVGLNMWTVVVGLVLYSLTVLVRGLLSGLQAVPGDVVDSATGMGYGRRRMFWQVELPLALPTAFAGLRVAAVSTVALTTIGFLLGSGGLGNLINDGLNANFKPEVLAGTVLTVLLAVAVDLTLVGLRRALTPWRRGAAA